MHEMEELGLLLVDDHPLFRDSFVMALRQLCPQVDVESASSTTEAMQRLESQPQRFDLVLVDYKLPGCDGIRAAVEMGMRHPGVSFGLITGEESPELPQRAASAGLVACLSKSLEMEALIDALGALARGQTVFSAVSFDSEPKAMSGTDFGLSPRQLEVLRCLSTGASNKVIAQEMGISPATVKNHLDIIFDKMGVTNRMQAVMLAKAAGVMVTDGTGSPGSDTA
ncbi:response regulator transcription factor [Hydrogenophaga sp. 5NK40-0174]|uniref:response regulator transcription factor n=1 Tax=Hydrogenophaga sp. 5NK40-0174 TaxID=3127649 RepID=UPI0031065E42